MIGLRRCNARGYCGADQHLVEQPVAAAQLGGSSIVHNHHDSHSVANIVVLPVWLCKWKWASSGYIVQLGGGLKLPVVGC